MDSTETVQPDPADDPEILALLDFEPVPRRFEREDGWTPALQRRFIANLALTGSPGKACDMLGKRRSGIDKIAKLEGAESFRAAWAKAVEIAQERKAARIQASHAGAADIKLPFVDHRRKHRAEPQWAPPEEPQPAEPWRLPPRQVLNEYGQWEEEEQLHRRTEDVRERLANKLIRLRRLYLAELARNPGKRAAFELLTELPVDWERALALQPQPDEPWRHPSFRKPDMMLMGEAGWMNQWTHGPDKLAELREAIDRQREEQGLPPAEWDSQE